MDEKTTKRSLRSIPYGLYILTTRSERDHSVFLQGEDK